MAFSLSFGGIVMRKVSAASLSATSSMVLPPVTWLSGSDLLPVTGNCPSSITLAIVKARRPGPPAPGLLSFFRSSRWEPIWYSAVRPSACLRSSIACYKTIIAQVLPVTGNRTGRVRKALKASAPVLVSRDRGTKPGTLLPKPRVSYLVPLFRSPSSPTSSSSSLSSFSSLLPLLGRVGVLLIGRSEGCSVT